MTLFLFEIYEDGTENHSAEYHDYWAETIEDAEAKMRVAFPDAVILNQFASI